MINAATAPAAVRAELPSHPGISLFQCHQLASKEHKILHALMGADVSCETVQAELERGIPT